MLEANDGLQRMLVQIPLTDEERAAVESDHDAIEKLINGLRDTATPAGPTPRELHQDTNAVPGHTPTTEQPPHS